MVRRVALAAVLLAAALLLPSAGADLAAPPPGESAARAAAVAGSRDEDLQTPPRPPGASLLAAPPPPAAGNATQLQADLDFRKVKKAKQPAKKSSWRTLPFGSPVVAALLAVVPPYDKYLAVENSKTTTTALLDLQEETGTAMKSLVNSFCGAPVQLESGELILVGGHHGYKNGIADGRDQIQMFGVDPDPAFSLLHPLRWNRWYPAVSTLADGRVLIVGGSYKADAGSLPPFSEIFDPKAPDQETELLPTPQNFVDNAGMQWFAFIHTLPKGHVLWWGDRGGSISDVASQAVLADLPDLPDSITHRTAYPYTSTVLVLPYRPEDGYTATLIIFGGAEGGADIDTPAVSTSLRLELRQCDSAPSGYCAVPWEVEEMGIPRVMGDSVLLPNGKVLLLNGAQYGRAAYSATGGQKAGGRASHPANQPLIYEPWRPAGQRYFPVDFNPVPRLYHSTACLHRTGEVISAGCDTCGNNVDGLTAAMSPNPKGLLEKRLQLFTPADIAAGGARPVIKRAPASIARDETFTVEFEYIPMATAGAASGQQTVTAASLVTPCAATHSIGWNQRVVFLKVVTPDPGSPGTRSLTLAAPPSSHPGLSPPGYHLLFLVASDGSYSEGAWVTVTA
ncbi:hypothetical protein HXX76_004266 [Chlamydomonas incerta]|uniref:Glyoxal or galactose oxidase n=1 Tax=Chlamydomonas incerta TaxID=51695 RepID=A0A835T7I3_CHLIN|nr:hypothetical protein HXX76_004266 [Chlamydomonas incerta]|eukprot:KAG2440153.1 hypothetical protein HXX76_004266 [Chlamydomonas incerta]